MEKLKKPKAVSPLTFDQLGILVLDGSRSMGEPDTKGRGTKAEAAGEAVKGLVRRLQMSTESINFSLCLIVFGDQVESPPRLSPTPVTDINLDILNTNPYLGGQTAIGDALEKAGEVVEEFLNRGREFPRKAVIMLISDGENCAGKNPISVSEALKNKFGEKAKICCVSYGKDADQETLKKISSDPEKNFTDTDDPESLRAFFEASIMAID